MRSDTAMDQDVDKGNADTEQLMPVEVVERVIVRRAQKALEVHFVPPFLNDSTDPANLLWEEASAQDKSAQDYARARTFIQECQLVHTICAQQFDTAQTPVKYVVNAPAKGYTGRQWIAICAALVEQFSEDEGVAGNWLKAAETTLVMDDTSGESAVQMKVVYVLGNDAERDALARKQVGQWFTTQAQRWFAVQLTVELAVDAHAEDRTAKLRQTLFEAERREVDDIVAKDLEQEANRPKVEERPTQGERGGYRRERRNDDEPLQPLTLGRPIDAASVIPIVEIADEMRRAAVEGRAFKVELRTLASGRTLVQFNITDETSSISAKLFLNQDRQIEALKPLVDDVQLRIAGQVQFDTYAKEIVFMVQDMQPIHPPERMDTAPEKRVELHLHTTMSSLDGVTPFSALVKQAAKWGHKAIAVTDHGVVQAFPDAYEAGQKHGVKVLLGVEAYVVDDGTPIVYRPVDQALAKDTTYIVFDTETTGLNAREDTLIEIAAVKMKDGRIIDSYSKLIDPERKLSSKISEITGITQDMLVNQPKLREVLPEFRAFAKGSILVAHNAEFDVGFLSQSAIAIGMEPWTQPVIDTLALARVIYPGEKNYRLKTLAQKFKVELVNHHRALADAEATGKVFTYMLQTLASLAVDNLAAINGIAQNSDVSRVRPFHATLFVQNMIGLRNLYELISLSHTKYLFRMPRIPRSELVRLREGLLLGTACQNGEVFQSFLRGKTVQEIESLCGFYDFIEIQAPSHYENLVRSELLPNLESVRTIHKQMIAIAQKLNKPVVATGDVHFLNPVDSVYREVFLQSQNQSDADKQPPLYLKTTEETLADFAYLGEDTAKTIVVDNTNLIADWIEHVKPIPDELFTPVIEGADDEIRNLSYGKARRMYGEVLPPIVEKRLEKELHSIISNGFSVIYLISHKLVVKSLSDGYLVGSRGSVGSSLVATMTDITEVNPLPPHYLCPNCQYSTFFEDGQYGSGFDLPDQPCPNCAAPLAKDGQDIPFETFLGFEGDKVPDIDLNFSGEYQPRAHRYTEELFGKDYVFRAGTISTVAEKTAYGYVRKFSEERGLVLRAAEIDRLVKGCTGIKRTSGQHPGGQMVIPSHLSVYDFTPVQYPADDKDAQTLTTHFDYHAISGRLLKLDILGHDDPTVIRMLQDLTGIDPKSIPLGDPLVLGLFRGTETLGVKPGDVRSMTGTYAIPEFGTKFVRQMLEDTRPTTFSELVRISGLSHGTDVWLNNAQELIRSQTATLSEVICARDDIMVYLIYKGLEPSRAFKIMESIRKGKGVKEEDAEYMRQFHVPEWYIESGRKIKYMFPKAHAAAYVIMAVRIAWFKIHHPLAFYATYFSVRAGDFDVATMASGRDAIVRKIEEIEQKGNTALPKEKGLLTVLEVALEMVVRGYRFRPVDLYNSHATKFLIDEPEGALLPPFAAIPGVGESAANNLYQSRNDGPYLSIEDLQSRSRISKTVIEILDGFGCFEGLPESNQLSLF